MSRFFPHTPYEEDQPLSHTILTTHVFTRALTTGSLVGSLISSTRYALQRFPSSKPLLTPRLPLQTYTTTLLRSAGLGGAIGLGIMVVGLPARMWGREDIEWRDRAWRLLENQGQVECDDFTYAGMLVAGTTHLIRGGTLGWRGMVGSLGLGSLAGMVGYMGWRYGIKGGNWDEK